MRTDRQLDRQIRRTARRLERVRRKNPDNTGRLERLEQRHARLIGYRALPPAERPAALKLSTSLVQGALDVALLALSATPAGPLLQGAKLGLNAIQKVKRSIDTQDVSDTIDGLAHAVRAELAERGIDLDEDDEALASLIDALEDQLDRDA